MCGISGFVDFNSNSNEHILSKMTDAISHRGPDDHGYFYKEVDNISIGLGHRRLSIIDLSNNGHQPMILDNLVMIYNGEIYNHEEIRVELIECGHSFNSNSDTEVALKAYKQWGLDAIQRFNGMFAIIIFDQQKKELTLIRDRVGVKPLYWYYKNGLFMFASELKSLYQNPDFDKEICDESIDLYFQFGYIPQPKSVYKFAHKLKSGHVLKLQLKNAQYDLFKYWDIVNYFNKTKKKISFQDASHECEELIKSSCRYRMKSDVPAGIFLSGGYDSSLVTALIQGESNTKIQTFTLGFNESKYNEAIYAKEISKYLKTEHHELICRKEIGIDILINVLPQIYDEPFGDTSAIPTYLISKFASEKVKVILSADGGDEVFGGYSKYLNTKKIHKYKINSRIYNEIYKYIPSFKNNYKLNKALDAYQYNNPVDQMKCIEKIFSCKDLNIISKENLKTRTIENDSFYDQLFLSDYDTFLPDDILKKVDSATMSVGLEAREPLLDYRLIEFIAQLPDNYKIDQNIQKLILKKITHKYFPLKLIERQKMGFGIPITDWIKTNIELNDYLFDLISENKYIRKYNFDLNQLKDSFVNYSNDAIDKKVYLLIVFVLWYKKWKN
jgi:asparagine synthase (glutamine-hydrolysing)